MARALYDDFVPLVEDVLGELGLTGLRERFRKYRTRTLRLIGNDAIDTQMLTRFADTLEIKLRATKEFGPAFVLSYDMLRDGATVGEVFEVACTLAGVDPDYASALQAA
jgi:hypothetical protein